MASPSCTPFGCAALHMQAGACCAQAYCCHAMQPMPMRHAAMQAMQQQHAGWLCMQCES
jgi:hypothetical protein